MHKDITSKNMDGITDLVVIAPIKSGFIPAFVNVTYATRLRVVAEALNKVRVAAREHEAITPFSDVTERILTLLDFRVGVLDKDAFSMHGAAGQADGAAGAKSQRYLYLTATFDGAWEPYMRLIWDPLGPFLDLLFCNCEGYVTAADHSFDEYARWVRDNQMDSAIFYAATGLSIRDHLYLNRLEYLVRSREANAANDLALAQFTVPNPEEAARKERDKALVDASQMNLQQYSKIHELALEALTVLYRLADFYPPGWLTQSPNQREGHLLARVAHSLLSGWEELIPTKQGPLLDNWNKSVVPTYGEILRWYETGKQHIDTLAEKRLVTRQSDPAFDPKEIQGGILKAQGSAQTPVRTGALVLASITNSAAARAFLAKLDVDFGQGPDGGAGKTKAEKTVFTNVAFTAHGLQRLGVDPEVMEHFPKEFREGMEVRSGLLGDLRENHPRNWQLPPRNWPPAAKGAASSPPPIELSEIDVLIQVRSTDSNQDLAGVIAALAKQAKRGLTFLGVEWLHTNYIGTGKDAIFKEHFGFTDGISQPRPIMPYKPTDKRQMHETALGEILLGYRNDRDDFAPEPFGSLDRARTKLRDEALTLQKDGTFLVVRKLEQHVKVFDDFIAAATKTINAQHKNLSPPMTPDRLKAKLLGRWPDGTPLIPSSDQSRNNFDYQGDANGAQCPFASHVRRTNPRDQFQGRKAPRILRRGMLFGGDDAQSDAPKGLMFMAYNASIAEQFETIQRWINGGNSTGVASGHNDPLLGVAPKSGVQSPTVRSFSFTQGDQVIRVNMPKAFVTLHWGQYFFVPSRKALAKLCALTTDFKIMEPGQVARGQAAIDRIACLTSPVQVAGEWKRILEDADVKDPAEQAITPDVWAAIRKNHGGVLRILPVAGQRDEGEFNWNIAPDETKQGMILCASTQHVLGVLKDWRAFSTEEQLRRVTDTSGPIYVAQQPHDKYKNKKLRNKTCYREEGVATNQILMEYGEAWGFETGYAAGQAVLAKAIESTAKAGRNYFKIELRRQYLLPALGVLCKLWYGLPDDVTMGLGGWEWEPPRKRQAPAARCPGDFLSPSRHAFYPRPTQSVADFAAQHGPAILDGCRAFVKRHRSNPAQVPLGPIAAQMFAVTDDDEILARNLVGTMVGAIPPMDGNLRGIVTEWLSDKSLWRHQNALRLALGGQAALTNVAAAMAVLSDPVAQAMCKRPAPDLLYRTALKDTKIKTGKKSLKVREGDVLVVSLVAATQQSLEEVPERGDVSLVFGGTRACPNQTESKDPTHTVHACPAQKMAFGAIMGIMAALLEAGRIQALPASMIVKVMGNWSPPAKPQP
jgi:Dyp-type peroxidase family